MTKQEGERDGSGGRSVADECPVGTNHNLKEDTLSSPPSHVRPDEENSERSQRRQRYCLVTFGFLYTFFFSGAFFGWGPMQLLLEENGAYASKCSPDEQQRGEICPAQSAALVRIHFAAQVTQLISPFLGGILDRYGPAFLSYIMGGLGCLGVALLVVFAISEADWLLYPAFFAIAHATWMGGLLTLQTALVFQGRTRARILFVINSLFDAGAITYLGLWSLSRTFGWSFTFLTSLYLGLAIVCFGGAAFFWTGVLPEQDGLPEKPKLSELLQRSDSTNMNNTTAHDVDKEERTAPMDTNAKTVAGEKNVDETVMAAPKEAEDTPKPEEPDSTYILVADRTPLQQILSAPFLLVLMYGTIMITANQWTLTTTRDFLASLGDDEENNKYLTIFTILGPASLVAVPCTDVITARYGFYGGFQAVNALALGYSLIRLLSDNLDVQVVGFVLFSFFRCFLFGITFSTLPVLLSRNVVGKAMGLAFGLPGVTSFVNIPLSRLAIEVKDDFFIPNLIYTVLIGPCVALSWALSNAIDKERVIRELRYTSQCQDD